MSVVRSGRNQTKPRKPERRVHPQNLPLLERIDEEWMAGLGESRSKLDARVRIRAPGSSAVADLGAPGSSAVSFDAEDRPRDAGDAPDDLRSNVNVREEMRAPGSSAVFWTGGWGRAPGSSADFDRDEDWLLGADKDSEIQLECEPLRGNTSAGFIRSFLGLAAWSSAGFVRSF
jgi:hypothetical protein